jgi:hypothetical protein
VDLPWRNKEGKGYPKRIILDYIKTAIGCVDCGDKLPVHQLEMDHCRGEKKALMSLLIHKGSYKDFAEELIKCDVVCRDCHQKRSVRRYKATGRSGPSFGQENLPPPELEKKEVKKKVNRPGPESIAAFVALNPGQPVGDYVAMLAVSGQRMGERYFRKKARQACYMGLLEEYKEGSFTKYKQKESLTTTKNCDSVKSKPVIIQGEFDVFA